MIKSIIVAVAENGVIGFKNQLLWKLSDDMKHFKSITTGHFVIMGRKTFESIGKPLKGRTNIVITRNPGWKAEGVILLDSLENAFHFSMEQNQEEIFIIGGSEIYRQSIAVVDKIYYTKVMGRVNGNVFFPEIQWSEWGIKSKIEFQKNEKNDYSFQILEMIKK